MFTNYYLDQTEVERLIEMMAIVERNFGRNFRSTFIKKRPQGTCRKIEIQKLRGGQKIINEGYTPIGIRRMNPYSQPPSETNP